MQGIEKIGDRLQAQANAKEGTGRRLLGQEAVQGLTLSLALMGDTKETFGPKQVLPLTLLNVLQCSSGTSSTTCCAPSLLGGPMQQGMMSHRRPRSCKDSMRPSYTWQAVHSPTQCCMLC